MTIAANLGYPRIGPNRELKKALESYWKGEINAEELRERTSAIRKANWEVQHAQGIEHIPSNDFSLYDHVLDTSVTVGAIPPRFNWKGGEVSLDTYFALGRGAKDTPALTMTKWFDTNYHYMVPEFEANQSFALTSLKAVEEFNEAKALGYHTRPVLLGPISYLLLGKVKSDKVSALSLLPKLLPVYAELLKKLEAAGAGWVQIDEPCLVLDLPKDAAAAYQQTYKTLTEAAPGLRLMLTTYFGALGDNLDLAVSLPTAGLHIDLVRAPEQLDAVLAKFPAKKTLSLGVVNGRNIWRTDLEAALAPVQRAVEKLGVNCVIVAPSCSLALCPVDLDRETKLDEEFKSWLSFAKQKLKEIDLLGKAISHGKPHVQAEFEESHRAVLARSRSQRIHDPEVKRRANSVNASMLKRKSPFGERIKLQQAALQLPLLPTTTIGSFPQTAEVRHARAEFKAKRITAEQYDDFLKKETAQAIQWQEEIGIDVLVHGEFERNDMVEYFGEQLEGIAFTQGGWVQSYGSRCVKPPVIFGDVVRKQPMTVEWSAYAQSLTKKIVKGMLTGPVTILQWSFVRDDQPREETCKQLALVLRDEVVDLEKAGIRVIQIDEPAIREGLPLRRKDWAAYLTWAVDAFRLSASGVQNETQIHTHMCYSEFGDIMQNVADMDADVISIETSRSQMELLDSFVDFKYPNQIGPGVYDIHSPRVPTEEDMTALLRKALAVLAPDQVWVNPDCGLKTRGWKEVKPALVAMVNAAKTLRAEFEGKARKVAG